jgi:death-on-curing protein
VAATRREPTWLSLDAVRAMHAEQILRFGGSAGVLQPTALDAAVSRPRNIFAYDEAADLADLAATYLVGLVNAHAFVDGNKRVGLAAMLVFLVRNDRALHVPKPDLYAFVLDVATGTMREREAAAWVRARLPAD